MGSPCGCARSTDATCSCGAEAAGTSPSVSARSGSRQAPRVPVELPRFKHTFSVFATPAGVRRNPGRTRGPSSDRKRSGASRRGNAHARSSLSFGGPTVMVRRWCHRSGQCDGGSPRLAGSEQRNRPRPGRRDGACAFHRSICAPASERSHAEACRTRSSPGSTHGRTTRSVSGRLDATVHTCAQPTSSMPPTTPKFTSPPWASSRRQRAITASQAT